MTRLCYRCRQPISPGNQLAVILLRLYGADREFGQYDYCSDCAAQIGTALGLSAGEREALRLPAGPGAKDAQEARAAVPPSLLDLRIEQLGLGPRAFNALRRAEIWTVAQVYDRGADGLLYVRNFGRRSLAEVEVRLAELGLPSVGSPTEPTP